MHVVQSLRYHGHILYTEKRVALDYNINTLQLVLNNSNILHVFRLLLDYNDLLYHVYRHWKLWSVMKSSFCFEGLLHPINICTIFIFSTFLFNVTLNTNFHRLKSHSRQKNFFLLVWSKEVNEFRFFFFDMQYYISYTENSHKFVSHIGTSTASTSANTDNKW